MEKTYQMDCEDGFIVQSHNRKEVIHHADVHMKEMHPEMKITKDELLEHIRIMPALMA